MMRTWIPNILFLALGAGLAACGSSDEQPPVTTVSVPRAWSLVGVSDGGRALLVRPANWGGVVGGACQTGPARVAVEEPDSRKVQVSVRGPIDKGEAGGNCSAVGHTEPVKKLRLRAPIAGRMVVGAQQRVSPILGRRQERVNVPNVVGLRSQDATAALCNSGFRAAFRGSGTIVTSQQPEAGTLAKTADIFDLRARQASCADKGLTRVVLSR
jgi:hypothetical protein